MIPVGTNLVVAATRRVARSALPDAPVLPDERSAPPSGSARAWTALANGLRALAARADRAAERVERLHVTVRLG